MPNLARREHEKNLVPILVQALKESGGIYLDLDTICVKPLHELFNNSFIIAQELKPEYVPKNWRQKINSDI